MASSADLLKEVPTLLNNVTDVVQLIQQLTSGKPVLVMIMSFHDSLSLKTLQGLVKDTFTLLQV